MENKKNKLMLLSGFSQIKILVMVFAVVGCASYLWIINTSAVKGYEIRKIENEISQARKEYQRLQIEVAELNSFYNMKERVKDLNMVEADDIAYIRETNQIIALR